jgi:hypothetical protein
MLDTVPITAVPDGNHAAFDHCSDIPASTRSERQLNVCDLRLGNGGQGIEQQ